jgi:hypothetical protein
MTTPDDDGPPPMVPFAEWAARQAPAEAREDARRSGRAAAMGCAAAHAIPFGLAVWITGAMTAATARTHFTDSWAGSANAPTPPPYLLWLLAIGFTCWGACTVAELVHAAKLGDDYPPRGPWARLPVSPALRIVHRVGAGLDRKLGAGGGCLGLVALAVLGPAVVLIWSVFTAAAAPLWVLVAGFATLVHLTTVI